MAVSNYGGVAGFRGSQYANGRKFKTGPSLGESDVRLPAHTIVALAISTLLLPCVQPVADCQAHFRHQAKSMQPNIVFLLIDDMGWPDVACYGHRFHDTPTIDRLAAEGMRFTDFYAATPVCSSTRSTIQTGQYSARTGITDFISGHWRRYEKLIVPPIDHHLKDGIQTPGHLLQPAGYATGYFGKWHLGNGPQYQPDRWGYQVTDKTLGASFKELRGNKPAGPKRIDLLTDQTMYFIEQH